VINIQTPQSLTRLVTSFLM